MKNLLLSGSIALLLGACAGDVHTTEQSPGQPARSATSGEVDGTAGTTTRFQRSRIYQVTRLETAEHERSEWRTLGETITQTGSTIEFTELGSGKTVTFTGPHQITATNSRSNRLTTQAAGNSEDPSQARADLPPPPPPRDIQRETR